MVDHSSAGKCIEHQDGSYNHVSICNPAKAVLDTSKSENEPMPDDVVILSSNNEAKTKKRKRKVDDDVSEDNSENDASNLMDQKAPNLTKDIAVIEKKFKGVQVVDFGENDQQPGNGKLKP